jgi:Peptidase family M23
MGTEVSMKGTCLGIVTLTLVAAPVVGDSPRSALPLEVRVPVPPTPVDADDGVHLVYELQVVDFDKQRARELEIMRLEVLGEGVAAPLASYGGEVLAGLLARPGLKPAPANPRRLKGGEHTVAFLWLTLDPARAMPPRLRHRLEVAGVGWPAAQELQGGVVTVRPRLLRVIEAPVGEGRWLAANGPSNGAGADQHRRTLNVVDGAARIPQRFAVDWVRVGDDGRLLRGDPGQNAGWCSYGAPVLAVADGKVVGARDGIPDNSPGSAAVEITLATLMGNSVSLDLGGGRFAHYAHLQPGTLAVRVGDRVRRGQVLGRVGNSGSSDAPHLHFQLTDGPDPLAS